MMLLSHVSVYYEIHEYMELALYDEIIDTLLYSQITETFDHFDSPCVFYVPRITLALYTRVVYTHMCLIRRHACVTAYERRVMTSR